MGMQEFGIHTYLTEQHPKESKMDIPCKDCITLSICRYKQYLNMFYDCQLIFNYLPEHNHAVMRDEKKLKLMHETINPKYWTLSPITSSEVREAGSRKFKGKIMVLNIDENGKVFNR